MRSILISIKPEWVAKILNGEKTVEIRKTAPKCALPITVYIYCTEPKAEIVYSLFVKEAKEIYGREGEFIERRHVDKPGMRWSICNGKVVAKFTLRKVDMYCYGTNQDKPEGEWFDMDDYKEILEPSCLKRRELEKYLGFDVHSGNDFFAWHISDLVIFDKPMKLTEFGLKRPPQSWQYVEEKE